MDFSVEADHIKNLLTQFRKSICNIKLDYGGKTGEFQYTKYPKEISYGLYIYIYIYISVFFVIGVIEEIPYALTQTINHKVRAKIMINSL